MCVCRQGCGVLCCVHADKGVMYLCCVCADKGVMYCAVCVQISE